MELLTIEYEVINTGSARNYLNIWLGEEELIYWLYDAGQFTNVIKKWIALYEPTEFGISNYVDRAYSGDTLELRFTKIQIGDQDLLADGLVQWEISGPGVLEIVEEGGTSYLRIFMSSSESRKEKLLITELPPTPPLTEGLNISFDWRVSSESGYDYFYADLDGGTFLQASGEDTGYYSSFFPEGEHTLRFRYTKDDSYSEGEDAAYVWNVLIDGSNLLSGGLSKWGVSDIAAPQIITEEGIQKIKLSCAHDEVSWTEYFYEPPPPQLITNIRIRYLLDGAPINFFSVETYDTFFVDAIAEGFDLITDSWMPIMPSETIAEIERYDEATGTFERISDSQVFAHPDGFFRILQKCDAPPGTYYLKTTATFGNITQIERLKIKAKVII